HRDGAPILTSPSTASILEDVFAEGAHRYDLSNTDELLSRVESISEWHDILGETVAVRPIPVGHTPGASGFLIRVDDGEDRIRMLATGDFTERDAATYRGFDPGAYPDVDVLFLTAATNDGFEDELTEAVGTIVERTNAGSKTLCTASGLTGVHLATLLAGVDDELDVRVPVVLAGQVAKLYDALGYNYEDVTTVPTFESTADCFEHGAVTIAGPEVPVEGSSGRLFESIDEDPSASLVQVQGGSTDAMTNSDFAGTVSAHEFSNHPTEELLDEVVEAVSPTHVVVEHQRSRSLERYKDKWDSFSWATGSRGVETLYSDGEYLAPPWVTDHVKQRVQNRGGQLDTSRADGAVLDAMESIPELGRRDEIDLDQEGVGVAALENRLHIGTTTSSETEHAPSTANEQATEGAADGGLYRTTGPDLPEPTNGESTSSEGSTEEKAALIDTIQPPDNGETPTDEDETTENGGERAESTDKTAVSEDITQESQRADESAGSDDSSPAREATDDESAAPIADETSVALTVEVDPAVRKLAVQQANDESVSLAIFARQAVDAYLADVLRGESPWEDAESTERSFAFEADPALAELLSRAVVEAEEDTAEEYVLDRIKDAIGLGNDRTVDIAGSESLIKQIDAVVENPQSPHETTDEVVQAAVERVVLSG
ncbi:hypothetical protein PNQ29_11250, partial [Halobacterium salinarum]